MKYNMRGVEGGGWPNIKKPKAHFLKWLPFQIKNVCALAELCNCYIELKPVLWIHFILILDPDPFREILNPDPTEKNSYFFIDFSI